MRRMEDLPLMAEEALGGLMAGQDLKLRIRKAARSGLKPAAKNLFRPAAALAMAGALVLLVAAGSLLIPGVTGPGANPADGNNIFNSLPAGQSTGQPFAARALLDVPPGSITLMAGENNPEFRSIWAPLRGGSFPLIGVNGKFYRLMQNPSSIPQNLLGQDLGQISEFTDEPALADFSQIISNVVNQGETVYAVAGMDSAMVAAPVDGELRAFQRVSFANNAVIGPESLWDTLGTGVGVVGLELSGVGTVTDPGAASSLVDILLNSASFNSAAGRDSSGQSLLIALSNGLTVQMLVKNDTLSACGSWSCPEFFEAFQNAVN